MFLNGAPSLQLESDINDILEDRFESNIGFSNREIVFAFLKDATEKRKHSNKPSLGWNPLF